jgi:dGTPase
MRGHGGFEGNAQTLRLLSRLEAFSPMHGADLTRRCLLGLLKYPVLASRAQNKSVKPRLSSDATAIAVLDLKSCKPVKACYDEDRQIFDCV